MGRLAIALWKVWGFFTPFIMYLFLSCSIDVLNLLWLLCLNKSRYVKYIDDCAIAKNTFGV